MRKINNRILIQIIYIGAVILISFLLEKIQFKELYNGLTAFLVIDISNTERKSLEKKEKINFYNSISIITRSLVCGFTSPLLYIIIFGNYFAIAYMIIYYIRFNEENTILMWIWMIFTIIPSLLVQLFLYIIYIFRHKKISIEFEGDYFNSVFKRPLLNVNILAAYVESINFYFYYSKDDSNYFKSYGKYKKTIEYEDVKNYLGIAYIICIIIFILFFSFIMVKAK
ncbi:hypothetical protein OW763_05000 [Clostridium aestuarii]|uniref:Uncharacterized protein n=1 Tax=Clostridium aestuarii TaxID=338193 RepID=A0ABT4CXJ5_9CLOT|nr:hypothetical protein [Clostridium aestuarii]MCY6483705.1 hypothetical protein [Clostridium aestuarii]